MTMTPERYEQVRQLFIDVCELDELHRSSILNDKCADDAELRSEVEALLAEESEHDDVLRESRLGIMADVVKAVAEDNGHGELAGTLGKYRVIRRIGSGGMGAVYEAEQDYPKRSVALKVMRPGFAREDTLKRFAHEAHVLGLLQHPGIAQIYDAGAAETNGRVQPYFVMELVRGQPLTDYAASRDLSTRARLEIMAQVAEAVHHAHTKGVVHRDLKPSNILVVEGNGDGGGNAAHRVQPKVLDFGVARATDSDVMTTTLHTDIGQLIGTVPYMSPEQASGDTDQIDTRSDIYSLGVVCYELLAHRLPYDLQHMKAHEAVRVIREDDPVRLSSINRTFRGDVETIIGKALEKDKERRYQSAADFAADIRRYLHDEPIQARPSNAMYQLRKFARRNKALVGGALAVLLVLLAGVGTTTYWAVEAIRQRDRATDAGNLARTRLKELTESHEATLRETAKAKAVVNFFKTLVQGAAPDSEGGQELTVRQLLDLTADSIVNDLAAEPEAQAAVQEAIGLTYLELSMFDRAEPYLTAARATFMNVLGLNDRETLQSAIELGGFYTRATKYSQAQNLLDETYETLLRLSGPGDHDTITALARRGELYHLMGQWDDAQRMLEETLDRSTKSEGAESDNAVSSMHNLALVYADQGKPDLAEQMLTKCLEINRRHLGDRHPYTLSGMQALANIWYDLGKFQDSLDLLQKADELHKEVYGPTHAMTLGVEVTIAVVLLALGRLDEAEDVIRNTLEVVVTKFGDGHLLTLQARQTLCMVLVARGSLEEARHVAEQTASSARTMLGDEHPDLPVYMVNLARIDEMMGRLDDAAREYREILDRQTQSLGPEHPTTLMTMNNLGIVLLGRKQYDEAMQMLQKVADVRTKILGSDNPQTLTSMNNLGTALRKLGKNEEARRIWLATLESRIKVLGERHPDTITTKNNLGTLLYDEGQYADAEAAFADVLKVRREIYGSKQHPSIPQAMKNLAFAIRKQGRIREAVPIFEDVVRVRQQIQGAQHPDTISAMSDLATAQQDDGDLEGASGTLLAAIEAVNIADPPRPIQAASLELLRGACLMNLKRYDESETLMLMALKSYQTEEGPDGRHAQDALKTLVRLYEKMSRFQDAEQYRSMLSEPTSATRP